MKATVKWVDNVQFIGESGSGHSIVIDGPEEHGGRNTGVRPMELMLLGMGGCTAFDVIKILKKSRQPIDDCIVELSAERADEIPSVFTHIHAHFKLYGNGLRESVVERAIKLTAEKYCSASIMLEKTAKITHDYEIIAE